jgi:hypothetical protein
MAGQVRLGLPIFCFFLGDIHDGNGSAAGVKAHGFAGFDWRLVL